MCICVCCRLSVCLSNQSANSEVIGIVRQDVRNSPMSGRSSPAFCTATCCPDPDIFAASPASSLPREDFFYSKWITQPDIIRQENFHSLPSRKTSWGNLFCLVPGGLPSFRALSTETLGGILRNEHSAKPLSWRRVRRGRRKDPSPF